MYGRNRRIAAIAPPGQREDRRCNDARNFALDIWKQCQSANLLAPVFELAARDRRNTAVVDERDVHWGRASVRHLPRL